MKKRKQIYFASFFSNIILFGIRHDQIENLLNHEVEKEVITTNDDNFRSVVYSFLRRG